MNNTGEEIGYGSNPSHKNIKSGLTSPTNINNNDGVIS